MKPDSLYPSELANLDDEHDYIKNRGVFTRRVKIEKFHTWTVRFLPAQLGPNKRWAARIARHWINGRPYTCTQETARDFGGDPDKECPLCHIVNKFMRGRDADAIQRAKRSSSVPQWLVYCLVFDQEDGRGNNNVVKAPERWKPWEFWLYQTPFEMLRAMVKKGQRDDRPLSIFDFRKGNNVFTTAGRKGLTLDKDDPSPLSKYDERIDDLVKKIMGSIQLPDFEILSDKKMDEACDKLQDYLAGRRRSSDEQEDFGGDRRRRSDRDDEDDRPRSRRSDPDGEDDDPPRRRPSHYEDPEDEPRGRRSDPEEEERPSRRRESLEDPEDDRPRRGRDPDERSDRDEDPEDEPRGRRRDPEDDEPPPARRSREADSDPEEESRGRGREEDPEDEIPMDDPPSQAREKLPPPPARADREAMPPPASSGSSVDEDDEVPEERHDPAPAATASIDDEGEEKPPKVNAAGSPGSQRLTDCIRNNIGRMDKR